MVARVLANKEKQKEARFYFSPDKDNIAQNEDAFQGKNMEDFVFASI